MGKDLKLDIDYDPKGDVLDVMTCKPYPTYNYILDFNFTLRLDPKSKDLVGLTIINFSELFPNPRTPAERRLVSGALLRLFRQLHRERIFKESRIA